MDKSDISRFRIAGSQDPKTQATDFSRFRVLDTTSSDYAKFGINTLQKDLESMGKTIQGIYDGWQTQDTMKKTKPSVESMYNRLIGLQDYRKQHGITNGDKEIGEMVDGYKSILDGWDKLTEDYGQYKDADAYDKAMDAAKAYFDETEKAKSEDLATLQKQVDVWKKERDRIIGNKEWIYNKGPDGWRMNSDGDWTIPYSATNLEEFVGMSIHELEEFVSERSAYLNRAKYIQNGIKLTNDALNSEYFDDWAQEGASLNPLDFGGYTVGGKSGKSSSARVVDDYKSAAVALFEHQNPNIEEDVLNDLYDIYSDAGTLEKYRLMTDEEFKIFAYWRKYDKENGTKKAYDYIDSISETLNMREGQSIADEYRDSSTLSKVLYGVTSGLDQFTTGISNAFNTSDDYIPTDSIQYAAQNIRKDLYDEGVNLPDWMGGGSLGQAVFDAAQSISNMAPTVVAGTVSNFILPGSGVYVSNALMGVSTHGNAYQQMLNQGYSKVQSRTYAGLVGLSEVALGTLLSGVTGGKVTEKVIEKAIKGIDNAFFKVAVRWGMSGLSEMPEEFLQSVLEPIFQNIAVGYELNDMSEFDWSQAVYEGVLGGVTGLLLGGGTSTINTISEQSVWNFVGKNIRANNAISNILDVASLMTQDSDAYETYTRYVNKGINDDNITDTQIGRLYGEISTYFKNKVETDSNARLLGLGIDKKTAKELSPIVAKAVFGEKLNSAESSTLNNSEIAVQVVKELSADRANTVWKDAIKSSRINNLTYNNSVTDQGEVLQSTADGVVDNVADSTVAQQGGRVDAAEGVGAVQSDSNGVAAPGVVEGADGKQYFDDGSGDEYFGDTSGDDVAHGGDEYDNVAHLTTAEGGASPQGEAIDGENSNDLQLSEPALKDIARAPTAEEAIEEAITGKQKTNIQRHIVDICKKLFPNITVEFVDKIDEKGKINGKFIRSQNKILIKSNPNAVQMYVEVFKHEFMHRLETKRLYSKFFNFCFKKSKAFEQYVRAELKSAGVDYNVDIAPRDSVLENYTKYKYEQYKNAEGIPKIDRDALTMENAQEEIIADFFAQILFQGKEYRARIIEALENADGESLIGIGDEISSEAALMELKQKEPTLLERVIEWFKDVINRLRGLPQAKSLVEQLDNEINLLESMARRAYQSKDSKRLMKKKLAEGNENKHLINKQNPKSNTSGYEEVDKPITVDDVKVLRSIGKKSINEFSSEDIEKAQKWAYKFHRELGVKSPFFRAWFGDWRAYDNKEIDIVDTKSDNRREVKNVDTGWNILCSRKVHKETSNHAGSTQKNAVKYLKYIDDITEKAVLFDSVVSNKDNQNSLMFHSMYAYTEILGYPALLKLRVEELYSYSDSGSEIFKRDYILQSIEEESVSESNRLSKPNQSETNSSTISISDLFELVKKYDKNFKPISVNKEMLNSDGTPKLFYHQTEGDFTEFDIKRKGAGASDNETPFGIFLKDSEKDIGLKGKKQMQLYVRMFNPLVAQDRIQLVQKAKELSPEYAELYDKSKEIDKEYSKKHEAAIKDFKDFIIRNSESENRKTREELYKDPDFLKIWEAEDNIVDEWQEVNRENDYKAKEALTKALKDSGYDGVILKTDTGSFGRSTNAYIVLDNTQVKSATDNIGTFDGGNSNIQYSLGSPIQQMRYNPEAYAKHLKRKYQSKADGDAVAKKIKQIVAQDNKSAKKQEDTRQKVYDRKGNLVGELTLKERLINELAVEISESIEAPLMAEADEVLSGLKERPLRVNEMQEAEIKHQFGTLANFRKDTGIRLVSEKSEVAAGLTTLEDAWNGDWVSEYAGWFNSDVSDVNMPIRLAEIVEQLNGMTEELDTEAIAAEVADSLTKTLNETGPRAEKRRVNEAYRRGVADEHAKNKKQISELQKQNRNLKNRVKPKDVQNIRSELSRIYKKLAANSSTKHVHQGLKKAVSEFLELFNQSDEFTFKPADRDKVTRLWREYQKLAETDATSEAYGYDAQIAINIEMLEDILPGRSMWELHPDELAQVKEIIQNVSHCIENVNNMIINGKAEEIATVANSVRVELGHKKGKIFDLGKLDLDMKNTTPVYFFERLGSKTLQKLFGGFKNGEIVWAKNMFAARDKIAEIRKRYGYNKWKDVRLKFTTKLGDQIELDLEQAMLLYATVKRERANLSQEAEHTYIGGVVIPTKKVKSLMSDIRGFTKRDGESDANAKKRYEGLVESLRKQIDVDPHQIRVSDFAKVSDFLTEQQKAYVDEMVAYLSNDMAKLGNEVSMQLFGIEKFNEKYYIPYNSADNFIASMPGVEPTSSIKHRSFTKDLTHGANNPLMLTSFSEVCANHIEQMCMYNAMAIPVDNLTRVLNYTVPGTETSKATSTKDEIERVLGKSGLRYINNLIRDMSGSVRVSDLDSLVGRFTSRYKKAAVLASLSVVIQQPTSIVRAFKYIPAKYFLKTTFKVAERNYEQMKRYVGEAIIKEMGGFDTGVGATNSDYLLQPKRTAGQVIDDVAGWGANKADQITWGHIWAASKRMVAEQNPSLQVGSDAFFEKAAEICSETLSKTQVYDSVLVKSEAMRSKSELSKMMTAFMSEPTVTYNMMMGALRDVTAHKKGAVKALAGTSAVIIGQIVVNAAFKSLVYAMRDDDEDETYFEKWLASFVESSISDLNYFNYLPYVKDIVSIMQGYSVERMDVAAIADIKQAIEKAFAENTTDLERLKNLCTALSLLTGVPVKNIWRDAEGTYNTIHNAIKKDMVNTPEGSEKAAKVGFAEALDWLPGIEIDTDGSARLVSELEGNVTYDSFDDADKQAVEKGVSNYLKNNEKFEKGELRSKSKTFESLYETRRKYGSTSKKYRKERKKLIDSGIDEKDLELGLEIAKFKYLEQNGITVAEYYAAKTELNRKDGEDKVYDTDGSGGLNKKETKAAIKKMKGFDKDEKDILFDILKP